MKRWSLFCLVFLGSTFLVGCAIAPPLATSLDLAIKQGNPVADVRIDCDIPGATVLTTDGNIVGNCPLMLQVWWSGLTAYSPHGKMVLKKTEHRLSYMLSGSEWHHTYFLVGKISAPGYPTKHFRKPMGYLHTLKDYTIGKPVDVYMSFGGQSPRTTVLSPVQRRQKQTVVLHENKSAPPTHSSVLVSSSSENGDIYIDGIFVGNTPTKLSLKEGMHIIEVKQSGYKDFEKELRVVPGGQITIRANLEKDYLATKEERKRGVRWAVIIGISKYQRAGKSSLNNLIFADDDAKDFADLLCNLGWSDSHIKLLTNEKATHRNIMIALESWLTKAGSNDQIILFWAGHGFADPEDPEKVYFACYDTDILIPATGYRMDNVRQSLEEKKVRNVVLLADTCHAGKLITRSDGGRGISIVPNIKRQNVPKGWVFMVGADTDRQAIEHSAWSNGAFTHSLIKGLNGEADGFQSAGAKDGIVTMGELKDYMSISMPDETQRVLGVAKRPVITTSTGDPDIWNLTLQVK